MNKPLYADPFKGKYKFLFSEAGHDMYYRGRHRARNIIAVASSQKYDWDIITPYTIGTSVLPEEALNKIRSKIFLMGIKI